VASLIATTPWSVVKGAAAFSVTLSQAATAGSTLLLVGFGGAGITAKITNSSGAAFSFRTQAAGGEDASINDFVAVGGETTVWIILSGAENTAGIIYEMGSLGAFIAASNNGTGNAMSNAQDLQALPSSAVNVASGNAVLVGGWSSSATFSALPFGLVNQWRQMGPLGHLYVNSALQPGANTQFAYASGLADVTSAGCYPADAGAGNYKATSVWVANSGGSSTGYAVQAAYADASGIPTNPAYANATAAENSLPGTFNTTWAGTSVATDSTIAGYCSQTSYGPGDTVNFCVDSTGNPYHVEIYRLGYYGWEFFGARNVLGNGSGYITGTIVTQPTPAVDSTLGSTSCGWTTSATWTIPSSMLPGLYYVLFRRTDVTTHFSSGHFIVRASSPAGKIAVVLSDYTYQAYNVWGATTDSGSLGGGTWTGRSLYQSGTDGGAPNYAHRAYAVSFDRPYSTHETQANTYFFDAESGVITFMEAQGYSLNYLSCRDLDDNTTLLNSAAMVMLLGHHEYWTANVYNCLQNAVAAGVNMHFVSSNTALWHVRFASADTAKRTMICYKESGSRDISAGFTGTGFDPTSYTGTWRDSRTSGSTNNTDIRRENVLTGQMFVASAHLVISLTVPFASKGVPIWRNSASVQALTTGTSYTTTTGCYGDEGDAADGSTGQPANLVNLCPTVTSGITSGANAVGDIYTTSITPTVGFTLYRAASGALVLNTGAWRGWQGISRWAQSHIGSAVSTSDANWQNAFLAVMFDLGQVPAAARAMRPGTDTALTNPATGAPTGSRNTIAIAYGLTAPASSNFFF
jgi:hypothetical protein